VSKLGVIMSRVTARTIHNPSPGLLFRCHVLDEIVNILVHLGIGIRRHHERVAFSLQDRGGACESWVNQGNYFEAGSEFAVLGSGLECQAPRKERHRGENILLKTERVVPRPYEK